MATGRVGASLLVCVGCAGEWRQIEPLGGPPPTQSCQEAKELAARRSRGPIISGYVMTGVGAATGVGAVISAIVVSNMRAQFPDETAHLRPSYTPTAVVGAAAVVMLAIGIPMSYQGKADRFDDPPECARPAGQAPEK